MDPFVSTLGMKSNDPSAESDQSQPINTSVDNKNESFEEIKRNEMVNTSASSANKSQETGAQPTEFRINNRVVKPDEIASATALA